MLETTTTIASRAASIVAISIACLLTSACSTKKDEDVAAIRAMLEKQEADKKAAAVRDVAQAAAFRQKLKDSR